MSSNNDDTETGLIEANETEESNVIALTTFIHDFGADLLEAVKRQNPPVYNGVPEAARAQIMDNMPRRPFDAQQRVVQAITRLLVDENEKAGVLNCDMGTGKTMMSIAASVVMHNEGYKRILVLSPPHLVYKWRREILESVDNAKVWILNGPDTLSKLLIMREQWGIAEHDGPEYFILGRVRMRLGYHWKTVITKRKLHVKKQTDEMDQQSQSFVMSYEYAACPDCGGFQVDEEGDKIQYLSFTREKRKFCQHCESPLWTLQRPSKKKKSRNDIVIESMCQIPTIGPKTAKQLVQTFGEDMMEKMLADNVYDFINLMDEKGDMIFTDRRALRMERSMANLEFGFGQGGYQPSEFVKRYLPDNYFNLMICDEAHEYKGLSAQGDAMGVLANKVDKVILLTGTLVGGYALDIFYLLWRILGKRMREDGYLYNERGSLGSAAMSFMREHGVLKDVYKESDSTSHRTARGKKMTVRTSKAPGFGPKGITRYILPYTVFLKLKDIGEGVLPDYREELIQVEMTEDQKAAYNRLSSEITARLKQDLARGDTTLLGVVINVLLRWPDTCFRPESVTHPRTRELIHFTGSVFAEDELSPKEEKMLELCKAEKAKGRRSLVYTIYTGKQDVASRYKRILQQHGLKAEVLRSSVDTSKREDWIMDHVDRGIDVMICNPELVKTGLDLLDFPTIMFMQSGFNTYTVQQASRRSWRIGQKHDVVIYFLGYEATAQVSCLELMAKKIAVSQSTSGDMPDTGLDVLNQGGDSIEVALARQLAV
ncbi:MAG: DEAD/DEAH box helicase family protein [Gammaproteobacteria bacterium]|nr:DEAD/DEAH box helicase family protein [Gammaproteobacteria bacterium]